VQVDADRIHPWASFVPELIGARGHSASDTGALGGPLLHGIKLSLSVRVFDCEACGLSLDRDKNAARNLASLALAIAQAQEDSTLFVAATGAETPNARGATDPEAGRPNGRPQRTAKAHSTGHPAVEETAALAA
jgi:hypothetical protein